MPLIFARCLGEDRDLQRRAEPDNAGDQGRRALDSNEQSSLRMSTGSRLR
jgi:hypothetical protein